MDLAPPLGLALSPDLAPSPELADNVAELSTLLSEPPLSALLLSEPLPPPSPPEPSLEAAGLCEA